MRKTIKLMTSAAFVLLITAAFSPQPKYKLTGKIKGIDQGLIYLSHNTGDKEIKDSAVITDGNFTFSGTVPEVKIYTLKIKGGKQQKNFFLENKKISITGDKDSLFNAKVVGSPETDTYFGFYNGPWRAITAKAGQIYRRLDSANQKGKITLTPAQRKPFDDDFKALDVLNQNAIKTYIEAHASSVAVAAIVEERFINYPNPEQAAIMYAIFSPAVKSSFYGRAIKESLALTNKTAPGKLAPDFVMNDVDGKPIKLSALRGKYVLVDFWASWCGPCRKENPNVVAAYKKYHDKGFEILGVSLDGKKEAWLKAIKDDELTWKHVSDLKGWSNSAAALYGVKSVPASFLLDKDGKVVAKDLRGEELNNTLANLFKD